MGNEHSAGKALLAADEPAPVNVVNRGGSSAVVLVCDHASNRVPRKLNNLGLRATMLNTHIAWDPGAASVARLLAEKLDAVLVLSSYSRLVIDCNRPLESAESIPEQSAAVSIPGNHGLSSEDREQRVNELFIPYQNAIAAELQRRNKPTVLLSIHSFTPQLLGRQRPWQVGVACYRQEALAQKLYRALLLEEHLVVGFNQPYAIEEKFDYTIPVQGEGRGMPGAMIEIRQDEIGSLAESRVWADRLAAAWRAVELSIHGNGFE